MSDGIEIENLEELIKDSIHGKVVEQKVSSLLSPGENFASVLYKVDFKVEKDDSITEFQAVAKCIPSDLMGLEQSVIQAIFKIEIDWYTKVIPTLIEFQKGQGVEETIDFFQKIYGARISLDPASKVVDLNAVLLSQNLKYLGYTNVNIRIGFNLATSNIILSNLAKFHAVPIAMRYHNPNLFNASVQPYLHTWSSNKDPEIEFCEPIFQVYQHIPECGPLMERIRKTVDESNIFQKRAVRDPWATVIHMDFWSNNIMISDGRIPKIIILDLQSPGFASPAADVSFFLLTSVQHEVISNNFDDLVKFYHDEFIRNLEELNVPIEKLSYEAFLSEFDTEIRTAELAHALGHIALIYSENETVIKDNSFVNDKHIEKFRWMTCEAEKRKWI